MRSRPRLAATSPRRRPCAPARAAAASSFVGLAAALAAPVAAYAAVRLASPEDVARSTPAGTLSLADGQPACTVVVEDVELRCTLARAPAPEVADWTGTVEPTADGHGPRERRLPLAHAAGMTRVCHLGQRRLFVLEIVDAGFLGEAVSGRALADAARGGAGCRAAPRA